MTLPTTDRIAEPREDHQRNVDTTYTEYLFLYNIRMTWKRAGYLAYCVYFQLHTN